MKNLISYYNGSQMFPIGSGSRFVFKNIEKKEIEPVLSDLEYAKNLIQVNTETGVDLVQLDTAISTQEQSKEKLAKFNDFSALVHKKIDEKYSAEALNGLSEEQLAAKMKEMADIFEYDPDVSDYWKKNAKEMVIPNDLQQYLGLSGTVGFMAAVRAESGKKMNGLKWFSIAAVATHPFVTNGLAWTMRKAGKHIAYPILSTSARAIDTVAFDFGGLIKDPIGKVQEIFTGKNNAERDHEKKVLNFASGQAESITSYAGTEIKGWQGDIVKYKAAKSLEEKDAIASTLILQTAEFVVRSMPQFLNPKESMQVSKDIENGNAGAESLRRYSAMIFSGNYFEFFLKEADPKHKQQFLDTFKSLREKMERKELQGYTAEELQSKFSGITENTLKLEKIQQKGGIQKALSKPMSSLFAIYLSIWAGMKLFMGMSNTFFNKQWLHDKTTSTAAHALGKLGSSVAIPIKEIDRMKKGMKMEKIIDRYTFQKNKTTKVEEGALSKEDAKKWKKALSDRGDRKTFIDNYANLMVHESKEGKKEKKDVLEITLEELKSCLPEKVKEKLYPPEKKE
jgi:hypothetical protein